MGGCGVVGAGVVMAGDRWRWGEGYEGGCFAVVMKWWKTDTSRFCVKTGMFKLSQHPFYPHSCVLYIFLSQISISFHVFFVLIFLLPSSYSALQFYLSTPLIVSFSYFLYLNTFISVGGVIVFYIQYHCHTHTNTDIIYI